MSCGKKLLSNEGGGQKASRREAEQGCVMS
jgi:hypothetical protein